MLVPRQTGDPFMVDRASCPMRASSHPSVTLTDKQKDGRKLLAKLNTYIKLNLCTHSLSLYIYIYSLKRLTDR